MSHKFPSDDQFEWDGQELIHKPTGARWWWLHPDVESTEVGHNAGHLGAYLANGDFYNSGEVGVIARRLLAERGFK
jgi:hypothetical protein